MSTHNCGCEDTCTCPIKLDFSCIIYNKENNDISNLTNLNLSNGTTLKLFAETVDSKFANSNFTSFTLTNLRFDYVINNLKQFSESVDTEIGLLRRYMGTYSSDPSPSILHEGCYWYDSTDDQIGIFVDDSIRKIALI